MKVIVINFSGNVGKSTVAAHLLKSRMNNAILFSVETLNNSAASDGVDVETYKGKKYKDLMDEIVLLDDAIVDVGASNVEDFIGLMTLYKGSHKHIDYFVVPTVKERKQSIDTITTIDSLLSMGIPKRKLRVIFNKVDISDDVRDEFAPLFVLEAEGNYPALNEKCVIYNNEAYDQAKELGIPLADIVADKTNYIAQAKSAKAAGDMTEARRCVSLSLFKMTATTAHENLDAVFTTLFGPAQEKRPAENGSV